MNNEELKEKIVDILNKIFTERDVIPVHTAPDGKKTALPDELCEIFNNIVVQAVIPYFADALIAAGIVDKSDYASMKETAVRYKAEVSKEEARAKEAEHRAEVAERAGRIIQRDMARVFDVSNPRICELIANIWDLAKKQAEKELAEERKE